MMNLKQRLDARPDLQKFLFRRGFLLTSLNVDALLARWPFYGNWHKYNWGGYNVLIHNDLCKFKSIRSDAGDIDMAIVGHAYNPISMQYDETAILQRISDAYGTPYFQSRIDELTGLFVLLWKENGTLYFMTDASGMQSSYYSVAGTDFSITSHPQLLADIYGLEISPLVRELSAYKWYMRVTGPYLPADLSPFEDVRRIMPNFRYSCSGNVVVFERIFPMPDSPVECRDEKSYRDVIAQAAGIMKNNMALIARKWRRPAISLTGGIDSNTTFAAANGMYDLFETFSYYSAEKESVDCEAARKIANRFNVRHRELLIPSQNDDLPDFDLKSAIITHNTGYVHPLYDNEMRKRIYLEANYDIDVEVKSWVSETIRGACYHRYGRTSMPDLSPKLLRNLYKMWIGNRSLVGKIDRLYADFIERYGYRSIPEQYPIADIHFWEVTWGSWGGMNIMEMRYCFEHTIPYNNRKLLELLFRVPLSDRLTDRHHLDMKRLLNKELYDMGIHVVNMNETRNRARFLNAVFTINNILPF